jgi:hypothetical protein
MRNEEALDAKLGELLKGAERGPDEIFLARMERALVAERRMEARSRLVWRRFAVEVIASIAVAAAFVLIGRAAPAAEEIGLIASGSLPAAGLLLILWMVVEFRPAGAAR